VCYWKENINKNSLTVFLSISFNELPCLLLYCTGSLQISPFDKILSPIQVTKLIVPSKVQNQLFSKIHAIFSVEGWERPKWATAARRATQCDYKWLKSAENVFTWCDFTNFFKQHLTRFTSYPLPVISHAFIFKICQTVASTSIINQISRFFLNIIFGGFLPLCPNVGY
jgi:mannosyltransferase OCH1-like enzyme